jgi:hypothetical protein
MSNLSTQLKDYLSKSSSPSSPNNEQKTTYWFSSKGPDAATEDIDESSNGWFSEAQSDPLLPNLVSTL